MVTENNWIGLTAIVTGAGQGIGYEICRQLIQQEDNVILNDSDETLAREAARRLGPPCLSYAGDVADQGCIKGMVQQAVDRFGWLDIVVANAGITLFGNFFTYTPESFFRVMLVNLAGSFFLAQAAALQMRPQGSGGSVLFMSSVTGHQAHKD